MPLLPTTGRRGLYSQHTTHTITHESGCAAFVGGHAAFVGGSEVRIPKRDEPHEVTSLLYRIVYYIETIIPIQLNPP